MAAIYSLPLEIIDSILGALVDIDDERLSSIKACSLACQAFHLFSRKHIFASVSLNSTHQKPPRRLKELLAATPEIGSYVRNLEFSLTVRNNELPSPTFSDLLQKFTQVQCLTISNASIAPVVWDTIPHGLRNILHYIMRLPTFEYLQLICVQNFPWKGLAECTTLRQLRLKAIMADTIPVSPAVTSGTNSPLIKLKAYTMDFNSIQITKKLFGFDGSPIFDVNSLRKLSAFCYESEMYSLVREMVKKTSQLTFLSLFAFRGCSDLSEFLSPILPSLRIFKFQYSIGNQALVGNRLDMLRNEFESMRARENIIEELGIRLHLDIPRDPASLLVVKEKLSALDKVLDISRWSSLRSVSVDIESINTHDVKYFNNPPRELLREIFPILLSDSRCRVQSTPPRRR
ncbi:hypothetical protein BDN70DRAFT_992870 [Pholiota conissans]|uniref:F-box domain-containing protein n=1 Tax=Pholiota conissans TaxID=109636 RepID=A0A9P5Z405_9AGAR|nr:hypothetical protein BDN70DRAFT_992870 [Pholiota conissans]